MSIRVLHVLDHLGFGGGPVSVKNIVENTTDENFELFVCSLRPAPTAAAKIKGNVTTLGYGKYDPRSIWAIMKLCKKNKIDILHAHLQKSIIGCLLISYFYKAAVVIHERGAVSQKGVFFSIYRFLLRLLAHRAAAIIANSQAIALELTNKARIEPDRIKVLYNPVDFRLFDPETVSRKQSRENLGVSDEDFLIGFVGRLRPIKGPDVLIKAVSLLLQKSPRYCLVLAGDGPQRESLEELTNQLGIAKRVKFLGMCDNVPAIMAAFDIGVITSRQEPLGRVPSALQLNWGGRVAAELMRMKIPIVASGKEGVSELIKDEFTGLLTRQNDAEDIANAIERLAEDKELQRRLIDNACSFSGRFDVVEHIKKVEEIYREVLCRCEAKETRNG